MASRARVLRGRETERLLADYLSDRWPAATATAASLKGDDVLNVGALAIECKATAGFAAVAALRQVHKRSGVDRIPVAIWRPPGYGEARIEEWITVLRLGTFFGPLAEKAGRFE